MNILVEIKCVYGEEKIYPTCQQAKLFAQIAGTKTLTRSVIDHIKALGIEVNVKPQVVCL
ncbi:MAG TPA: hypothetical protein VN794_18605 [Methylomirabilota bacterium]|nr:hypothetical protein [Methylomirabilota bacterium]